MLIYVILHENDNDQVMIKMFYISWFHYLHFTISKIKTILTESVIFAHNTCSIIWSACHHPRARVLGARFEVNLRSITFNHTIIIKLRIKFVHSQWIISIIRLLILSVGYFWISLKKHVINVLHIRNIYLPEFATFPFSNPNCLQTTIAFLSFCQFSHSW